MEFALFCRKDLCWLTQRSRALSNISTQPKNVSFQVEVACIILWKAVLCKKKVWFIHSIHTYISSDFTEDEGNQGDIVEALTPNHLQMAALVCCVSISLFEGFQGHSIIRVAWRRRSIEWGLCWVWHSCLPACLEVYVCFKSNLNPRLLLSILYFSLLNCNWDGVNIIFGYKIYLLTPVDFKTLPVDMRYFLALKQDQRLLLLLWKQNAVRKFEQTWIGKYMGKT